MHFTIPCVFLSFMPVPDYQSLFLPVLQASADGNEHSMAELRDRIAANLKLTPEDLALKLPSGKQSIFTNRVAWAVVYLAKALALDRVKRGVFRIANRGRQLQPSTARILATRTCPHIQSSLRFKKVPSPRVTAQNLRNLTRAKLQKNNSQTLTQSSVMHWLPMCWRP